MLQNCKGQFDLLKGFIKEDAMPDLVTVFPGYDLRIPTASSGKYEWTWGDEGEMTIYIHEASESECEVGPFVCYTALRTAETASSSA